MLSVNFVIISLLVYVIGAVGPVGPATKQKRQLERLEQEFPPNPLPFCGYIFSSPFLLFYARKEKSYNEDNYIKYFDGQNKKILLK